MNSFALYILKVCLGIALFAVPYYFLLRNDTALRLKRFFLLGGVFASFLFPLLALKKPVAVEVYSPSMPIETDFVMPEMEVVMVDVSPDFAIHWPTVIMAIYLCGALILLFRNIFMLLKWNTVWRKADRKTGVAYSGNDEVFAMFTRIFLPNNLQDRKESDAILLHEKAHIRQLHFIDLVIMEFTILFTWFNPFTWLLLFLVKENHEHLADRMVLKEGIDSTAYRTQLLNQAMGEQVFSLAHPFNHSSIKKRFVMMKKSGSIRSAIIKVAVLLPITLVSLGFAVSKARQGSTISGKIVFADTGQPAQDAVIVVKNTTIGTVADEEGNYQLELKDRAEVVFSYVGYVSQTYWFKPGEYRFVALERDVINLPSVMLNDGVKSDYRSPDEVNKHIVDSTKSFEWVGIEEGEEMYFMANKENKQIERNNDRKGTPVLFNGKSPWLNSFMEYLNSNMREYAIDMNTFKAAGFEISFFLTADGKATDVNITTNSPSGINLKELGAFTLDLMKHVQNSGLWTPPTTNGKAEGINLYIGGNHWNSFGKLKKTTTAADSIIPEEVFYVVEDMPKFNNGDPAIEFRKYITQNLRYPKEEAEKGISGRVIVQFTVNADGSVSDAEVVNGSSPGLDNEAIRVVESSPSWTPGKQRGKAVAVKFTFPISFALAEKKVQGNNAGDSNVFYIVEEMPRFNSGDPVIEFRKYISENLQYPEEEKNKNISGRVIVQFIVSSDGSVKDAKVVSGASPGLDKEALRVVELSSPAWTPGKHNGEAVNVMYTFPVTFMIQVKEKTETIIPSAPEFLILVETIDGMIKLTGLKGCAWKVLTFSPTFVNSLPYVDQNGVGYMQPRKSDPSIFPFGFRVQMTDKKIDLKAVHGTNWKDLSFSWRRGECKQLINQDGLVEKL
jgi:TonB family protein